MSEITATEASDRERFDRLKQQSQFMASLRDMDLPLFVASEAPVRADAKDARAKELEREAIELREEAAHLRQMGAVAQAALDARRTLQLSLTRPDQAEAVAA